MLQKDQTVVKVIGMTLTLYCSLYQQRFICSFTELLLLLLVVVVVVVVVVVLFLARRSKPSVRGVVCITELPDTVVLRLR